MICSDVMFFLTASYKNSITYLPAPQACDLVEQTFT